MLVSAAYKIEQRCLAAVGIAYQGDVDDFVLAGSGGDVSAFMFGLVFRLFSIVVVVPFVDIAHLNQVCLGPAQRHLIVHQRELDGILQRCVQHHRDLAALDKPHFHDALAEGAMTQYLDYYS